MFQALALMECLIYLFLDGMTLFWDASTQQIAEGEVQRGPALCDRQLVPLFTSKEHLSGEMVIYCRLGCSDLETVEFRILRRVAKEKSKNSDLGLQASILKCVQETFWWDPVQGHCLNAKKMESRSSTGYRE